MPFDSKYGLSNKSNTLYKEIYLACKETKLVPLSSYHGQFLFIPEENLKCLISKIYNIPVRHLYKSEEKHSLHRNYLKTRFTDYPW